MIQNLRNHISHLSPTSFASIIKNNKLLYREVEEFLSTIFYHLLQTNPKTKAIVIIESFYGLRPLIETIGHCCFKSYGAQSLYFVLGNATPLYTSGMDSGIIVDMGFQQAQILPIVRSRLCIEGLGVSYCGGAAIEKELGSLLVKDNMQNQHMLDRINNRLPRNFPLHVVEDIKTRVLMTMQMPQKEAYFAS